jgi:hypothetical protein
MRDDINKETYFLCTASIKLGIAATFTNRTRSPAAIQQKCTIKAFFYGRTEPFTPIGYTRTLEIHPRLFEFI